MYKYIFILLCSIAIAQNPYRTLNSFNSGELTPLLNAREDLAKYQNGCSVMENLIPLPQGGAQKRPGTKYIAEVKDSSAKTRLLPFEFSTSQSYIIELGSNYSRFYTNASQITTDIGNEDISGLSNVKAHWKLNDDAADTVVVDADGATHNAVATTNTVVLRTIGKAGSGCFGFSGAYAAKVAPNVAFSFGNATVDGPFSIMAWVHITETTENQTILSKFDTNASREWAFQVQASRRFRLLLYDQPNSVGISRLSDDALSTGWHHVACTYAGQSVSGPTAANFILLYVDGVVVDSTAANNGSYDAMNEEASELSIGSTLDFTDPVEIWQDKLDDISIFNDVLTPTEIADYYADTTSAIYEIETPWVTSDLFELKFEQSADVLYITHPDYETRKLSRKANSVWAVDAYASELGPFRTQNINPDIKITPSGTTGSITLTAVGGALFNANHVATGSNPIDASETGALFRLIHPLDTLEFKDTLEDDYAANQTEGISWMSCGTLYEGAEWTWVTGGTWLGTVEVQRNYTIGAGDGAAGWETVLPFSGITTARNVSTSGTEDNGDADYRVIFTDDTSGIVISYFTTDQTEVVGVVEITAVASSTSATATVIKTLGSTDATHKWSEGAWSNYRGWPQTVTFFEDRLMFGGNTSQPDTIWGSVTGDYENMTAGADDDEAVIFTLSSRQVNVIEWLVGKDKLLIGTSGAEWTIAGGTDEPLAPANVIAKQHSTFGSANLQANLANESVLFFQRGKQKMRELAYNWELDSYVAPDMTILANLVTGSGIDETAFQKIPDSILWCIRNDGELPVFAYERQENITAWSRMVTEDSTSDSDFESVAVISGSDEDEVWVIVKRTINSSTVRYIEQFQPRDFGSDADDAYYVDCGITYDSSSATEIAGLSHLKGEPVGVLADGAIRTNHTVKYPVGHWQMNDSAPNTNVVDVSDNGNDGTAQRNTIDMSTTGKINLALDFNGTTDYITVLDNNIFSFGDAADDSPFSISAWVYIVESATNQKIVTKSDATVGEWIFHLQPNSQLVVYLIDNTESAWIWRTSVTELESGKWIHVACTYNGAAGGNALSGLTLYIDGALAASTTNTNGTYIAMVDGPKDVGIGAEADGDNTWGGKIDDVRIYDSELSASEVLQLYNGGDGTEFTGGIILNTAASTVQIGLPYEVHLRTMPLSWIAEGPTIQGIQKRISEVIANWYVSGDFQIGRDVNTLRTMSISGQTTAQDRITFPAGYTREGFVYVYQKSPEPLTILALVVEFDVN